MLILGVKQAVGVHHVIHHVRFADFLGAELLRSGQIPAVVVPQVIVRHDGCGLNTRAHLKG